MRRKKSFWSKYGFTKSQKEEIVKALINSGYLPHQFERIMIQAADGPHILNIYGYSNEEFDSLLENLKAGGCPEEQLGSAITKCAIRDGKFSKHELLRKVSSFND
ncbi:MAG: hypothetical protein WCT26_03360 [Candidatus Buchananbacteria bacterium]|jgi:hypothetical protein